MTNCESNPEVCPWGNVTLQFVNKSPNPDPEYAHIGDSGFDLRAWVQDLTSVNEKGVPFITIQPNEQTLVHTGIYCKLPMYAEIQVRPRSGLALKYGITVTNSPGTIDECYTNEIGVIVRNEGKEPFVIENGDRIAQAILAPVFNSRLVNLVKVDEIPDNDDRGQKGFGSSGTK